MVRRARIAVLIGLLALAGCASPPPLPAVPVMTPADRDASYEAYVESRWQTVAGQYPDVAQPVVDRIRYITPGEMPDVIVECLKQEGHDAFVSTDAFGPALQVGSAEGQGEALALAWYVCDVQYPIDPTLTQPLSAAEVEYMYDYNVRVMLPCLASHGHQLTAPSKQVYVDTFGTAEGWYPYGELLGLPSDELQALGSACPQNPPGFREAVSG